MQLLCISSWIGNQKGISVWWLSRSLRNSTLRWLLSHQNECCISKLMTNLQEVLMLLPVNEEAASAHHEDIVSKMKFGVLSSSKGCADQPLHERILAVLRLLSRFASLPGCSTTVVNADGVSWVSKDCHFSFYLRCRLTKKAEILSASMCDSQNMWHPMPHIAFVMVSIYHTLTRSSSSNIFGRHTIRCVNTKTKISTVLRCNFYEPWTLARLEKIASWVCHLLYFCSQKSNWGIFPIGTSDTWGKFPISEAINLAQLGLPI